MDDNNNGGRRERERNREEILITVEIFDILSKDEMMEQLLFFCVSGPYLIILSIMHTLILYYVKINLLSGKHLIQQVLYTQV